MVPYTDADGLRDWRAHVTREPSGLRRASRWPWLVLIVCLVGLALRVWR